MGTHHGCSASMEGAHGRQHAGEGEGVADPDVRCDGTSARDRRRQDACHTRRQRGHDTAVRIDEPRDAGGRRADEVAAGLDRAEGGHCEVLPTRQAVSTVQPAVIGDVDQELGPLAHGARDQLGK